MVSNKALHLVYYLSRSTILWLMLSRIVRVISWTDRHLQKTILWTTGVTFLLGEERGAGSWILYWHMVVLLVRRAEYERGAGSSRLPVLWALPTAGSERALVDGHQWRQLCSHSTEVTNWIRPRYSGWKCPSLGASAVICQMCLWKSPSSDVWNSLSAPSKGTS